MTTITCTYLTCNEPVYGHNLCSEHYSDWWPSKKEYETLGIVTPENWHPEAITDGFMYSMESSQAMRLAVKQDATDRFDYEPDIDGAIQFEHVVDESVPTGWNKPELSQIRGTYAEVAASATKVNRTQDKTPNGILWVFAPAPLPLEGMAA